MLVGIINLIICILGFWLAHNFGITLAVFLSPFFTLFKRKVFASFVVYVFFMGVLSVLVGEIFGSELNSYLVGFLFEGVALIQAILAYALSYYKLDYPEKYEAPNGYLHHYNALGIPTVYLLKEEEQ